MATMLPTGIPLRAFSRAVRGLSVADITKRFAPAFLVGAAMQGGDAAKTGNLRTRTSENPFGNDVDDETGEITHGRPRGAVVFCLSPPADSDRMTIGRKSGEIIIPHSTISTTHAAILVTADGGYAVVDIGSSNGTMVGTTRIQGPAPTPLHDAETIQFGDVEVTFYTAASLLRFVKEIFTADHSSSG